MKGSAIVEDSGDEVIMQNVTHLVVNVLLVCCRDLTLAEREHSSDNRLRTMALCTFLTVGRFQIMISI